MAAVRHLGFVMRVWGPPTVLELLLIVTYDRYFASAKLIF